MSFVEKENSSATETTNNNRKIIIKRRDIKRRDIKRKPDINISDENPSDLGKRNLEDSFGSEIYNDKERYGQDIPADFFKTNIGHGLYPEKTDTNININNQILDEAEILDWCYKYLASKNIQI